MPPSPFCKNCREVIQDDPDSPTGVVHASRRLACRTGGGQAEREE